MEHGDLRYPSQRRIFLEVSMLTALGACEGVRAQGSCSTAGMTLDEALAMWSDAQQKAKMDKDAYFVLIQRKSKAMFKGKKNGIEVEELGALGTLSVNGFEMGDVLENDALRISAGAYRGVMRYGSKKNFVQGPLGVISDRGDFLLEIAGVNGRTALLIHPGNRPWHSKGCILAGTATKKQVNGKDVVTMGDSTTLRRMRKAFYGGDGEPNHCPNRIIRITIRDI